MTPPLQTQSGTGSVSRYVSNFFWKKDNNNAPSSPGKDIHRFDSTSPSNVIDFEKDAEEITEVPKEIPTNENCVDSFRFVDNEFDAEVVQVESMNFPNSVLEQIISPEKDLTPPVVLGESKILSTSQITQLARHLPIVIQHYSWVLLYSVLRDGADFSTFFSRTRGLHWAALRKLKSSLL
jgi:hypothetical protein